MQAVALILMVIYRLFTFPFSATIVPSMCDSITHICISYVHCVLCNSCEVLIGVHEIHSMAFHARQKYQMEISSSFEMKC